MFRWTRGLPVDLVQKQENRLKPGLAHGVQQRAVHQFSGSIFLRQDRPDEVQVSQSFLAFDGHQERVHALNHLVQGKRFARSGRAGEQDVVTRYECFGQRSGLSANEPTRDGKLFGSDRRSFFRCMLVSEQGTQRVRVSEWVDVHREHFRLDEYWAAGLQRTHGADLQGFQPAVR